VKSGVGATPLGAAYCPNCGSFDFYDFMMAGAVVGADLFGGAL
jgi:hypothetical protein